MVRLSNSTRWLHDHIDSIQTAGSLLQTALKNKIQNGLLQQTKKTWKHKISMQLQTNEILLIVLKEEVLLKLTETTKHTKCLKLLLNVGYMDMMLDMTAILDAILNYTFLPHIWNVYTSIFSISYGSPTRIKSQNWGHIIAHRTPSAPGLICLAVVASWNREITRN